MPYENPYAPPDNQNSGSGTAVPENWTTVAPTLNADDVGEESPEEDLPRRRHKGKNRA